MPSPESLPALPHDIAETYAADHEAAIRQLLTVEAYRTSLYFELRRKHAALVEYIEALP